MSEDLKQEILKKNPPNIEGLDKESILEDEIFDYANIPDYLRSSKKNYDHRKKKDNDLSR